MFMIRGNISTLYQSISNTFQKLKWKNCSFESYQLYIIDIYNSSYNKIIQNIFNNINLDINIINMYIFV